MIIQDNVYHSPIIHLLTDRHFYAYCFNTLVVLLLSFCAVTSATLVIVALFIIVQIMTLLPG